GPCSFASGTLEVRKFDQGKPGVHVAHVLRAWSNQEFRRDWYRRWGRHTTRLPEGGIAHKKQERSCECSNYRKHPAIESVHLLTPTNVGWAVDLRAIRTAQNPQDSSYYNSNYRPQKYDQPFSAGHGDTSTVEWSVKQDDRG